MDDNPYVSDSHLTGREPVITDELQGRRLRTSVFTMQVISLGLLTGVLMFLAVVLLTTQGNFAGKADVLTVIGVGMGLLMMGMHFAVPPLLAGAQLKQAAASGLLQQTAEEQLQQCCGIYQLQLIVGLALLEGAAFFNLVALLTERSQVSLGVVAVLLSLMAMKLPTVSRVTFWMENQLRQLQLNQRT